MSAAEQARRPQAPGVSLASCAADILEIAAFRGRASELAARSRERGVTLPPNGQASALPDGLALAVRPERWLLVLPLSDPEARAREWRGVCGAMGAVIELSSGLVALHLTGPAVREVMKRGCRLDLGATAFPVGAAAASALAQVAVILAALPSGLLLLTPATTAQHLREWLASAARPFGFQGAPDVTVAALLGDRRS